jgi:hypothetical protein
MTKTDADVEVEIAALADLDLSALRRHWGRFYPSEAPERMSREVIIRAVAYRLQEEAFGGLSRRLRAKLFASNRVGQPESAGGDRARASRLRTDRSVKPGTRFIREWNGTTIEVIGMADGRYRYQGEAYRSLSAIARKITGTRWSGPAFFGLGPTAGGRHG